MLGKRLGAGTIGFAVLAAIWAGGVYGNEPDGLLAEGPATRAATMAGSGDRHGWFGLLDRRSAYGTFWFPEPLLADEADVDDEIRFDWFHGAKHNHRQDEMKVEIEKSFGLFTFEIAPTWKSESVKEINSDTGKLEESREEGFGNIELGLRFPVYQYVSPGGSFDTTLVFGIELAVPTHTRISQDLEIVPKLHNLTRLGEHVAIQAGLGVSILAGPAGHGESALEYDFVLAYELTKEQMPIPWVLSFWPMFEIDGECPLNHDDAGHNSMFGTVGARINFDSIPWLPVQPRLGLGYTFPLDQGARDELHWGIVTSFVFEF